MKKIILLTDYKNYFGSKWDAVPYNSGFDKKLLETFFKKQGYETNFIPLSEAMNIKNIKGVPILYTSSEDVGYHYKDFIEDIIYSLELKGANIIPSYQFLRANNNKVFMELLRKQYGENWGDNLKSWVFGTLEEMENSMNDFDFPIVIKTAKGAMSRGVSLARNKNELVTKIKKISRSKYIYQDVKDSLRPLKHKEYKKNSLYRNKFILQSFIPNLKNDWKILIFGDKYFVLTRHVRKNDFRASGSHTNYMAGSKSVIPEGLLDFAKRVYRAMKVPHLSIDVVYDNYNFHLIEFQAVYFGTSTINMSDVFYKQRGNRWEQIPIKDTVESYYVDSVLYFLRSVDV